jgi:hypothetical protein
MASSTYSTYQAALDSLTLFEDTYEGIEILGALPNEQYDDSGDLAEVMDVTFRIRGRPGQFQVHPPFEENWQAVAFFRIGMKAAVVNAIYDGIGSLADLPTDPATGDPIPFPGSPIPV